MRKIFSSVVTFLMMGQLLSAQDHRLSGEWLTNAIIGYQNLDEYKLIKHNSEYYVYGNRLKLNDDLTFQSYYTARCGNDCFPATYGKYKLTKDNEIHFQIDSIVVRGFCENKKRTFKDNNIIFYIKKTNIEGKEEIILKSSKL